MIESNYRPISLLPLISKILEKIMYHRLFSFIKQYNILYSKQYGFQKGKSTEMAILDLQSCIIDKMADGEIPCSIFLDFAKAFDTVNHDILIQKLKHYGIRGPAYEWFKSYLSNRKQCICIGDQCSDLALIKHGVPQGSVLGPLLFLLYINDITASSSLLKFFLFADDTCLFFSHKSKDSLVTIVNDELAKISEWLTANKLSLNTSKSNVLIFRPKNASNKLDTQIMINGKLLKEKESAKYLGILIDNKLLFKTHIDHVNNKLIKGNSLLAKIRHFVPTSVLRNVYNAHIQPFLNYGALIWGSSSKTNLQTIENTQDKSLRIINFCNKFADAQPLYDLSKLLPFDKNRELLSSMFIWRYTNKTLPKSTETIFLDHGVKQNVRKPGLFVPPHRQTDVGQRFITYNGIKNWNLLPQNIRSTPFLSAFKRELRKHLQ